MTVIVVSVVAAVRIEEAWQIRSEREGAGRGDQDGEYM